MPAAVIRGAGKKATGKRSKSASRRKYMNKSGGAIYTFDLERKVGGQAEYRSLYKTTDSDCPAGGVNDFGIGYDYYDSLKSQSGGKPKTSIGTGSSKHKGLQNAGGCGCQGNSTRTPKNNLETQRGGTRKYRKNRSKSHKKSHSRKSRKH